MASARSRSASGSPPRSAGPKERAAQPRSSNDRDALGDTGCHTRVLPLDVDTRHEALLHVASMDLDGGATAALTVALHERAFRPWAGNRSGFAPRVRHPGGGAAKVGPSAAFALPSNSLGAAGGDALRVARHREAQAAWAEAAAFVADACESFLTEHSAGLPEVDDFLAHCLALETGPLRTRHGADALALAAGALRHSNFPDVLDAALGALAIYASEDAPFDASAPARAARTALLLVARFALLQHFSDGTSAARALGCMAALAEVPAEAPPDGVPRGRHSGDLLVLVADAMAVHPHSAVLQATGMGALAALLGARRALSGAPEYADGADAELRAWAARGALTRTLRTAAVVVAAAAPEPYGSYNCEHACHMAAHVMRWAACEVAAGRLLQEHPDAVALSSAALAVAGALAGAGCALEAVGAVLGRPLHDFMAAGDNRSSTPALLPPLPPLQALPGASAVEISGATTAASPGVTPFEVDPSELAPPHFVTGEGDSAAVDSEDAAPALPQCLTALPTAADMDARCDASKAEGCLFARATTAFVAAALNTDSKIARGASAAAARAFDRAAGRKEAARRDFFSIVCICIPVPGDDLDTLNMLARVAPGGRSVNAFLAHCLTPPTPEAHPPTPRGVIMLAAGALVHLSAPEACIAALACCTRTLEAAMIAQPEHFRRLVLGEPGMNALGALVRLARTMLCYHADDPMVCGAALEALSLLLTFKVFFKLMSKDAAGRGTLGFTAEMSTQTCTIAVNAMLRHAPFMAVQAPGATVLADLLAMGGGFDFIRHDKWIHWQQWTRGGALALASAALLFALRRAAVAAAKAGQRGGPTPLQAEHILMCVPAALASALRIACADNAGVVDTCIAKELSATAGAVVDACAVLEALCSDAVVAAADSRILPALTMMLSSRRWRDHGGAAAFGPERTALLLAAVARARARERTDVQRTVAEAAAPHLAARQPAPVGTSASVGAMPQPAGDELMESLLVAQADMEARLRAMESRVMQSAGGDHDRLRAAGARISLRVAPATPQAHVS
jgi:hypothetical protein